MNEPSQPSREALASLHESAYRWALACCDFDEDEARDVMQTVYVEILGGGAVFAGRSSLKTWLFAVVRRTALRLAAGRRRIDRPAEHPPQPAAAVDHGANGVARIEARTLVLAAVTRLPPRQRDVVELVYYHDLTLAESAAVMGIGMGAVRQHFHRAKRTLARNLASCQELLGDG